MQGSVFLLIFPLIGPLVFSLLVCFSSSELTSLEFLGVFFSLSTCLMLAYKLLYFISDSWLGNLLGLNINISKLGSWAVVTGGKLTMNAYSSYSRS